jgi:succinyl-diaminopimelate desuccinylase
MDLSNPVALAQALLRCRSITPDHNNAGDDGAMDLLQGWLSSLGFAVTRFDRNRTSNLYARRGPRPLCFAGHTDVVPVGEGWRHDPFGGVVENGILYGRGAVDMKGAIAAFIAAAARQPQASAALLITGDEEGRAQDGTQYVLEALAKTGEAISACIVGEPASGARVGDTIKIGRRGSLNGRVAVKGVQGHSAYPHLADNPIPKLARVIEALAAHEWDRGTDLFPPTTLAFTNLAGGTGATNVIPGSASATFNIRFNPLHDRESIAATLAALPAQAGIQGCDLTLDCSALPFQTEAGAFVKQVQDAAQSVTGMSPKLSTDGGTSDARFIAKVCADTVELGLANATAHKVDEGVPLADLETLTKIYEKILSISGS